MVAATDVAQNENDGTTSRASARATTPVRGKRCCCEICTCGRHHCPHKKKTVPKGPCQISEYINRYRPFPIELRDSFKPKAELRGSDKPMEDKTNHRVDYVPHPLPDKYVRPADRWMKPEIPMDLGTCYHQNYTGKPGTPTKAARPPPSRKISGKFDGEPTYRADYPRWDIDRRKSYAPHGQWIAPDVPLGNPSTYQDDYPGYMGHPVRDSMRPADKRLASDQPFPDLTDYRNSYVPHPIPPKYLRPAELYKGPTVPLDALTTVQRDYQGKQAPKVDSCKPDQTKIGSDAPLDDMTTVRLDYRPWPTQPHEPHRPDAYVRPPGDMERGTTYNTTYTPKPTDRTLTCKPTDARKPTKPFEGDTNYNIEYKKWDGVRPPKAMTQPEFVRSEAPFDGISTTRSHFTGQPLAQRTQSCRPLYKRPGDKPFDDSTMYRLEYTGKRIIPCPVPTLEFPHSGYTFKGEDTAGHRFYTHHDKNRCKAPLVVTAGDMPLVPEMAQRSLTVA